jgi:hypothetical protein
MEKKEVWRWEHPMKEGLVAVICETERGYHEVTIAKEIPRRDGNGVMHFANFSDWEFQLVDTLILKAQGALLKLQAGKAKPARSQQYQAPAPRPAPRAMAETTAHNTTTAMAPIHQGAINFDDDDVPNF